MKVNVQNVEGKTPLHLAAEKNYTEAVKMLLAKGADKHTRITITKLH